MFLSQFRLTHCYSVIPSSKARWEATMKKHPVLLHIRQHTWLWIAAFAVLGLIMAVLRLGTPAAFSFMVVGLMIIMKSQGTDILAIVTENPLAKDEGTDASNVEGAGSRLEEPVR